MISGKITKFESNNAVRTSAEILKAIGADFEVAKQPLVALNAELLSLMEQGFEIPSALLQKAIVDGYMATARTDTNRAFGVVKSSYGLVQNAECFDFIDLMTGGDAEFGHALSVETAGMIDDGRRIFVCAKLNDFQYNIGGGDDPVDLKLVITTSHDGSGSVIVSVTPVRVVCMNTLNMAVGSNSLAKICFRHTARVAQRMDLISKENRDKVAQCLHLSEQFREAFDARVKLLTSIRLTDKQSEKIVAEAVLTPEMFKAYKASGYNLYTEEVGTRGRNIVEGIIKATHEGVGQTMLTEGTGFWLSNGVSNYYQHYTNVKDEAKDFADKLDGGIQKRLDKVQELILKIA